MDELYEGEIPPVNEDDEEVTVDKILNEIVNDLISEISASGDDVQEELIQAKVRNAFYEFMADRRYPEDYSEEKMMKDLMLYRGSLHNLALYDYNQVGSEFQSSMNENGTGRTWVSRRSLKPWLSFSRIVR